MSGIEGLKDKGEGWIDRIGYALMGFGVAFFLIAAAAGILFWMFELIPFFWERGNYTPAVGTAAFVSFVVGGIILGRNKES